MKYPATHYAQAFISLLEEHPHQQERFIKGLVRTVQAAGDEKHWDKIVSEIERIILKREGQSKVVVQSVRPLGDEALKKIKEQFDGKTVFEQKIQPDLLAGVRVVVNEEQMIDASLRRKLRLLFEKA